MAGGDEEAMPELLYPLPLVPTSKNWMDYHCTPINVDVFASTSMDGAHFGVLQTDTDIQPVVLVAPDASNRPCVIVGETLHEFLSLGCEHGFGWVVEVPHRPAEMVKLLEQPPEPLNEASLEVDWIRERLLENLRERFQLRPWTNIGERLMELQEEYLDELDMPGSEDELETPVEKPSTSGLLH